jgi:NH3-dependent NAD+ synthetase
MTGNDTITLRVTQASLNQTALDFPRNTANIYAAIDEAVAQGSDILALEELTLTGYEANDDFQRTDNTRILSYLDDIAAYAKALDPNLIISVGHPWRIQMRDIDGPTGAEFERIKDPLYDRLNLPFNMQTLISGGSILAMSAKTSLYNDGRGYEKRYFNEWSMDSANRAGGTFGTINLPLSKESRESIPVGSPILFVQNDEGEGIYLAQAICETKWAATKYDGYPDNDSRYDQNNLIPAMSRYIGGKDGTVLLVANASPPALDKIDAHVHLNKLAAKYFDAVIDTDGLGSSGSTFAQFGHRMIAQDRDVKAYGARMSFGRVATTTSNITVEALNAHTLDAEHKIKAHKVLSHEFRNLNAANDGPIAWRDDPAQEWDNPSNPNRKYEELVRNTSLWLFDYLRKTGGRGVMEALSGGADSAFNSVLVSTMVHLGIKELGVEAFCKELRLPYADKIVEAEKTSGIDAAIQTCMDHMLTCVYMGTKNNASSSYLAAEYLMKGGIDLDTGVAIKGIGGKFIYTHVQDLLNFYAYQYAVEDPTLISKEDEQEMRADIAAFFNANPNVVSASDRAEMAEDLKEKYPHIARMITAADGTIYENMQARIRMVLIRMYAEDERKVPVANPNLDEIRNGYTTTGGDEHSGNIGLNSHIGKAFELDVMQYLYKHGLQGVMPPVRALGKILNETPSAGLMPLGPNGEVLQTDEDSLQRSYPQMNKISQAQLNDRIDTINGARLMNAGEVFDACKNDELFEGVDDNHIYNMLRMSYNRWAVAQHKIHMGVIGPTLGQSVDHQTSRRTSNLSGQSKDELTKLGVRILFDWAKRDGLDWSNIDSKLLEKRAEQEEGFIAKFDKEVWVRDKGLDFNLESLYGQIKSHGWDHIFGPADHRLSMIHQYRTLEAM